MINGFIPTMIPYPWKCSTIHTETHTGYNLYTPVWINTFWNIHYTHHRSHRSVRAIHHFHQKPEAHSQDGCVNFSKSESEAEDEPIVCAALRSHQDASELKNNVHVKGREGRRERDMEEAMRCFFNDLHSFMSFKNHHLPSLHVGVQRRLIKRPPHISATLV